VTWLLDTDTCIRYLNPRPSPVQERMRTHPAGQVVLCDIVKMELYFGAYKSQRPEHNLPIVERFFSQFMSLPFDSIAAQICGQIRAELAAQGRPIGPYDAQIAAIALATGATLVTHNTREFMRVPGLPVEDWAAP
jgi:tRNA(fMet)-specific endonuclease VapC